MLEGICWNLTFSCPHFIAATAIGKEEPLGVTFSDYHVDHVNSVIDTMANSTLYHLRNDHLIIDGVGLLRNMGIEPWLVFIQVSIKSYTGHRFGWFISK